MRKNLEPDTEKSSNVVKSNAEWRKTLAPEEFRVTREHGTERAFSHPFIRSSARACITASAAVPSSSALKLNTIQVPVG